MLQRIILGLVFVAGTSAGYASDLLKDPDFSEGLEQWKFHLSGEYRKAKMPKPDVKKGMKGAKPYFHIDLPYKSAAHYAGLAQEVPLKEGTIYHLKFDLRGEGPDDQVVVMVSQIVGGKFRNNGLAKKITPETKWMPYELLFKASNIDTATPVRFGVYFGLTMEPAEVRDFSLTLAADQSGTGVHPRGGLMLGEGGAPAGAGGAAEAAEPVNPNVRTWTTTRGSTMEGEYISYSGGMVTLKKVDDEKEIRIPMLKLSKEDQEFIRANQ